MNHQKYNYQHQLVLTLLATGTIKLKARFPQQETTLFPNQFVNVRLYVTTLEKAVVIPKEYGNHKKGCCNRAQNK